MSSASNGIFTFVLGFLERLGLIQRLREDERLLRDTARERDLIADLMGYPRMWLVCPGCALQSYRLPPHGANPCPIAQSAGLKLDAERMTAIQLRQQMEEATRLIREQMGDEDDDEE